MVGSLTRVRCARSPSSKRADLYRLSDTDVLSDSNRIWGNGAVPAMMSIACFWLYASESVAWAFYTLYYKLVTMFIER